MEKRKPAEKVIQKKTIRQKIIDNSVIIVLALWTATVGFISLNNEINKERPPWRDQKPNEVRTTSLKQGRLFDKPVDTIKLKFKYSYETGFPLTGNDYVVLQIKK